MFSRRVPSNLTPNRLAVALARARADRRPLLDLTRSNPTRAGFDYPPDLLAPLADARGLVYAPEPFGLREAREAVSADYARRGLAVSPGRIVLTASTSEAYSILFKSLCDPGDEVLVPRPSYPLFEHLTRLDAVNVVPYDLEYHGAWMVDLDGVARAVSPRTRALLVVHPNNPTGSFTKPIELARLSALCAARGIAVIADEVFADYELTPGAVAAAGRILGEPEALTFSLGGLSKSVGLPQVKLAWLGLGGPAALVDDALVRIELVCDTYLSVSTPVQVATGALLENGASIRRQIQSRIARNHRYLADAVGRHPACRLLLAEGGWYAAVRVPTLCPEEDLAIRLLEEDGVLVHPGYFYEFAHPSFLVISLLPPEAEFDEAVCRVIARVGGDADGGGARS